MSIVTGKIICAFFITALIIGVVVCFFDMLLGFDIIVVDCWIMLIIVCAWAEVTDPNHESDFFKGE